MNYGRSFRLMVECAKRAFCRSPPPGRIRRPSPRIRLGLNIRGRTELSLMDFSKFPNESCICIEIGHGEEGNDRARFGIHFEFEMNA